MTRHCWESYTPKSFFMRSATVLVYCCMLITQVPFYLLGLLVLIIKLAVNKTKKATGLGVIGHGNMTPTSRGSKVSWFACLLKITCVRKTLLNT